MTRKLLPSVVAFALIGGLGACGPGEETVYQDPHDETIEQDRHAEQPVATRSTSAEFMPIDHSGVTGTALADHRDGEVIITLALEGLDPGTIYVASVHSGRCAADGAVRVPLGRITGNDDGSAEVELHADADEVPEQDGWSVHLRAETGEAAACADIVEP